MIDYIMNVPTIGDAIFNVLILIGMVTIAGIYLADKMRPNKEERDDE